MSTKEVGDEAEEQACQYLESIGWTIVERNFTCKMGEIDIVARKDVQRGQGIAAVYAIVEVKARKSRRSKPEKAITYRKRRKLARLAALYKQMRGLKAAIIRFHVIAIDNAGPEPEIRHYQSAFDGLGRL